MFIYDFYVVSSGGGILQDEADLHTEALVFYNRCLEEYKQGTLMGLDRETVQHYESEVEFRKARLVELGTRGLLGRTQQELHGSVNVTKDLPEPSSIEQQAPIEVSTSHERKPKRKSTNRRKQSNI